MTETAWSAHARAKIAQAAKLLVQATLAQEASKAALAECEAAGVENARAVINTLAQVQMGDISHVETEQLNVLVQQKLVLLSCEQPPEPAPTPRTRRRKVKPDADLLQAAPMAAEEGN